MRGRWSNFVNNQSEQVIVRRDHAQTRDPITITWWLLVVGLTMVVSGFGSQIGLLKREQVL